MYSNLCYNKQNKLGHKQSINALKNKFTVTLGLTVNQFVVVFGVQPLLGLMTTSSPCAEYYSVLVYTMLQHCGSVHCQKSLSSSVLHMYQSTLI